jgi:hypothetical protein
MKMTDEFGFEIGSSEVYEGRLDEMLDRLEVQEGGGYESSLSEQWEAPQIVAPMRRVPLPPSTRIGLQVQKHKDAYARLMRAVEAMKKHVAVRNGRLHFTLPARSTQEAAARLGIDHGLFSHLHASIRMRNVRAGQTALARGTRPAGEVTVSSEVQLESGSSCAGVTKVETVWWGVRLWLDECKTQQLVGAIPMGKDALDTLCGALGGDAKVVCVVFKLIAAAEAPLIKWADDTGGNQGIVLSWTWAQIMPGVPVIPLVVSQTSA